MYKRNPNRNRRPNEESLLGLYFLNLGHLQTQRNPPKISNFDGCVILNFYRDLICEGGCHKNLEKLGKGPPVTPCKGQMILKNSGLPYTEHQYRSRRTYKETTVSSREWKRLVAAKSLPWPGEQRVCAVRRWLSSNLKTTRMVGKPGGVIRYIETRL